MWMRLDCFRVIKRELVKSVVSIGVYLVLLLIIFIFAFFLSHSSGDVDTSGSRRHASIGVYPSKFRYLTASSITRQLDSQKQTASMKAFNTKCTSFASSHRNISHTSQYQSSESNVISQHCLPSDRYYLKHHSVLSINKRLNFDSCTQTVLSPNSLCFFGDILCKPGYGGADCLTKVLNPWYSKHCPNLNMSDSLDIHLPLNLTGGEHDARYQLGIDPKFCSYLCFSHQLYGTAVVPISLWRAAQKAEGDLWRQVAGWSGTIGNANDRAAEHWKAYDNFHCLAKDASLGQVIEVGAGPWTQLKGLLHVRPDLRVDKFVVWEPSADRYVQEVSNCAYKTSSKLIRWDGLTYHPFPVEVQSKGGEALLNLNQTFDTVITMNVLEHVQDAFEYLTGIYRVLRAGGLLIMHERYYDDQTILDGDNYHPIRIKQFVLDKFFSGFHVIFNNCSAAYEGRQKDRGYYVIAIKI
jgi:SAM-dependent methyltransferase